MHKYEAMFILRPDLNESEKTDIFNQIKDGLKKFKTQLSSANIWLEKRKLYFDLALKSKQLKFKEGLYYLVEFVSEPTEIKDIKAAYGLNENILRFLILAKEGI